MGLKSSKHDPWLLYGINNDGTPYTIPRHPIHVCLYVDDFVFFLESNAEDYCFKQLMNKNSPMTSWAAQTSSSSHPLNGIGIQTEISQFMSDIRTLLTTLSPVLASNIATAFLSWLHTTNSTQSTTYPILTLMKLTSPNTGLNTSPYVDWLTGLTYQPALTQILSCPSFLPTKGHQNIVTMKRPCTPSDTLSSPPLLVFPITLTHPPSINHSSTSPLTTTWRPIWMPLLPDLTNPTSLPRTPPPAREFKSATMSLTARNFHYTNFAQCVDTSSPNAEASSPEKSYSSAAPH